MTTIGYARVSTDSQGLEAQHAALKAAGATQIYSEKISGAVTERKALARAIAALGPSDTLIVAKLDRLARSTRDLLTPWQLSLQLTQPSRAWAILGAIQPPRMGG
jgi:DNA invertase Pin-like site-specific DNA recombinase